MEFHKLTGDIILNDGNKSLYHIPEYQREFAWGTKTDGDPQIVDFWNDIWTHCWEHQRNHFIGTILCVAGKLEGKPCFDIVDGQQRITTLFLLSIAVRDFLKENKIESHTGWTQNMMDAAGQSRLMLSDRLSHDRQIINGLLMSNNDIIKTLNPDQNRMMAAHRWFLHKIHEKFAHIPALADEFAKTCLKRITLLFVTLALEDDAPTIFATLNDRGRPVDDYEKLRSTITMAIPQKPNLTMLALTIWHDLESHLDEKQICEFLGIFSRRHGYRTIRRTAHDEIKAQISEAVVKDTFPQWLATLQSCREIYQILLEVPDQHRKAAGILRLEIETIFPLLLAIIEKDGFDSPLLAVLEAVLVRNMNIYERPTTRFMQLTIESCDLIGTLKHDDWPEKLQALWREGYTVTDQDFKQGLTSKRLYGPGVVRRRLLYFLERIENSKHEMGQYSFAQNCTIEHIIPQTLSDEWKKELKEASPNLSNFQIESLHEANLHTIGNLTILLNSKQPLASNKTYAEKVKIYRDKEGGKRTYLNSYFDDHHVWGLNNVETRSNKIANIAKEIWKKP